MTFFNLVSIPIVLYLNVNLARPMKSVMKQVVAMLKQSSPGATPS